MSTRPENTLLHMKIFTQNISPHKTVVVHLIPLPKPIKDDICCIFLRKSSYWKRLFQVLGTLPQFPLGRYTFPICPVTGNEKLLLENGVSNYKSWYILLSRSEEVVSSLKFNEDLPSVVNFYILGCLMILPFPQFSSTTFYKSIMWGPRLKW